MQATQHPLRLRYLCAEQEIDRAHFQQQISQLNQVQHASIYPTGHQAEYIDGHVYLRLEDIILTDLYQVQRRLHNQRLTVVEALYVLQPISEALAQVNAAGLVHRNVKPSNILFDDKGHVYLTDFDLGGSVGGSAYVSPAQAAGRPATPLDDVYSLGVVTYEMLTGHMPYEPITAMKDVRTAHDKLTLPSEHEPTIPFRVEEVILKSFAKNPDDRIQSVGAFYAALEEAAANDKPEAGRVQQTVRLLKDIEAARAAGQPVELAPNFGLIIGIVFGLGVLAAILLLLLQ